MKNAGEVAHAPAPAGPGVPTAQFFIPAATSLQERRPRTLKHGDSFGVFDPNGDAVAGPGSPEGLYHRDTRYLSHLLVTLDGQRPMLLSSTLRDDNAMLTCDLTNPDLYDTMGRQVTRLVDGWRPPGWHTAPFEGGRSSQLYFYRLDWEGKTLSGKFAVVR